MVHAQGSADVTLDTLYSFSHLPKTGVNTDGAEPTGSLLQSAGNFYGTAYAGGAYRLGTVYELTSSGTFTTLYSFNGEDGSHPTAGLTAGLDGRLFGSCQRGGNKKEGIIFRVNPSGKLSLMHTFHGSTDGSNPTGDMILAFDNRIYGTTSEGGISNDGVLFQMNASGEFNAMYSLYGPTDGSNPVAGLTQYPSGNGQGIPLMYGVTSTGGPNGYGTVYAISPYNGFNGNPVQFTVVYSFTGKTDGGNPLCDLFFGHDGNFYGTTSTGGADGFGTVFKISPSGSYTKIADIPSKNSYPAQHGLIQASDGNLYGILSDGEGSGSGSFFEVNSAGTYTALMPFSGDSEGITQLPDGSFYGTSQYGGANGTGSLFKLTDSVVPPPFTISSLSPRSCAAGAPTLTLKVLGTNFKSNAVVLWNGKALPTVFKSVTELDATVDSSLITEVISPAVTVNNEDGAESELKTFYVTYTRLDMTQSPSTRNPTTGEITVICHFVNSGYADISDFTLTKVKLGTTYSDMTVPLNIGGIPAGETLDYPLTFPGTAGAKGASVTIKVFAKYPGRYWIALNPIVLAE